MLHTVEFQHLMRRHHSLESLCNKCNVKTRIVYNKQQKPEKISHKLFTVILILITLQKSLLDFISHRQDEYLISNKRPWIRKPDSEEWCVTWPALWPCGGGPVPVLGWHPAHL